MMRRVLRMVLVLGLLALVAAAAYTLPRLRQQTRIGSAYVAHQVCSCVFLGGGTLESCQADLLPPAPRIRTELLPSDRAVRAWFPLFAEATARFQPHTGCTLE